MSKYISFDTVGRATSAGIVDMRSALDVYPMPMGEVDGTPMPTPHVWPDVSILIKPGLTMVDVERAIMGSFDLIFEQYHNLGPRAVNEDHEIHPKLRELALRARGIITTP